MKEATGTARSPIYVPRGKAREYCAYAVNIYDGCPNGCFYCSVPGTRRITRDQFLSAQARENIAERVREQLARGSIRDSLIHLCFTCDPYPYTCDTQPTREVIQAIKESGNHVEILTKSGAAAMRDFDLLDGGDLFGITFTYFTHSDSRRVEPYAADPTERLATLKEAKKRGIGTWVSCEPVLNKSHVYDLITDEDYIDEYRIGTLNHIVETETDWAQFGRECERLCRENGRRYYLKDGLRMMMNQAHRSGGKA